MNRARQPRSVVIAFAVLLGFGGCGSNRAPEFSVRRSSEAIQSLTTDLIGTPLSDDASLTRALDKIARSVLDLRTSSTEEYRSRHGRGPRDNVELMGRWLGLLRREHAGERSTAALRDAAAKLIAAVGNRTTLDEEDSATDVVSSMLVALSAAIPNEDADNAKIVNAGVLRSVFQSAAVSD